MALRQLAQRWAGSLASSGAPALLRPFSSQAPSVFDKM